MLRQTGQNIKYEFLTSSCSCLISSVVILQSRHIFSYQALLVYKQYLCFVSSKTHIFFTLSPFRHQVFHVFINQEVRERILIRFCNQGVAYVNTIHFLCRGTNTELSRGERRQDFHSEGNFLPKGYFGIWKGK